jgi:membrane associated rhomboid family serine protease
MIIFLTGAIILAVLFAGFFFLLRKKIVTNYRGALMIILSGVYFTLFFYIAYLMQESFK